MNIERLEQHIKEHPADYQSVIALFKQKSKAIEKKRQREANEMLRRIAECRRELNEKRELI